VLATFFIDRPIFAWVISIVIVVIGGVAVFMLPIDQYPPITPPTVSVTAAYPGASARVVADTVAAPIEQQVNGVEKMLYMSSQSTNDGNYVLTITFQVGTDLNLAQVLVQNRVALAQPQLPAQVQLQGVSTKKKSPDVLFAISLTSPDRRFDELYMSNYATIRIVDELLRIDGVGDISYLGQRQYAMRLWLDPEKLALRQLTAVDVTNAITNQNVQVAAGQIGQEPVPKGQQFQLPMTALGRLTTPKQFGDIILKAGTSASTSPSGSSATPTTVTATSNEVVRIKDVGRIELGAQNYDQAATLDGNPSVGLAIFQLPGSNALDVADKVKARMRELSRDFPAGLEYGIIYDTTPFIRQSVDEVFSTLIDAVILVAIVVLFFLQDWRAMILPMIDVPVSLVGTFAVMAAFGFSLNNLTLFGLVLAIGIVVDDAIVVLENIERLIATGLDARSATIQAMAEITGPIVAITLVLCSVFLPSVFLPGISGQFFRQFALTISVAMIISAINAMTLTPSRAVSIFRTEEGPDGHHAKREALPWWFFGLLGGLVTLWLAKHVPAARFGLPALPSGDDDSGLSKSAYWVQTIEYTTLYFIPGAIAGGLIGRLIIHPVNAVLGWIFVRFNKVFDHITAAYGWTIGRLVRLSAIVLVAYCGLGVLTYFTISRAPTSFLPTQDQGYLLVSIQLPDSASVQRTEKVLKKVGEIAKKLPGVEHTVGIAGQSFLLGTNGSNLGSMFAVLKPFDKRHSADEYDAVVAQRLQKECYDQIEDATIAVFRPPPIRGLGNAGGFQLQTEQRGFVNPQELQATTDELVAAANKDPHFGGVFSLYRANTPQLFVDVDRTKCESLQVPVQDVFATLQAYLGGQFINLFNEFGRTWQVQVQAEARFRRTADSVRLIRVRSATGQMVPLGTLARIEEISGPIMAMRYNMYESAAVNGNPGLGVSSGDVIAAMNRIADQVGAQFDWTAMYYLEIQAGSAGFVVFILGSVLVYLVLAAKYESWRLPLSVILVVPMCLLSAVVGMLIAHLPVDIFVQIGFLVLIGMASKNAILIVEFAKQLQDEGKGYREAILEASRLRFRPIVMTSFAFIFGVMPLVLAEGAGAEMRQALGVAVLAGMIGVTFFGVFLTPVFFAVIQWLSGGQAGQSGGPSQAAAAADTPGVANPSSES
jgi:multidrug efflux pump